MALQADRTLVKSPPELWELVGDPALMRGWCAYLVASSEPIPVEVTERDAGSTLAWRSVGAGPGTAIELSLAEKGFGTRVTITVTCDREPTGDMLESLLDELGSPQRRPFARA
jgi:hypothetical protein